MPLKESSGNPIAETLQMMRFADAYDVYLGSVPVCSFAKIGQTLLSQRLDFLASDPLFWKMNPGK